MFVNLFGKIALLGHDCSARIGSQGIENGVIDSISFF